MDTWWSDEQVGSLRIGDVMPLPLMLETGWTGEGWEVNVVMVTRAEAGGYTTGHPIWTDRQPYIAVGQGRDEADRVTEEAAVAFGDRLRAVLADPGPPSTPSG